MFAQTEGRVLSDPALPKLGTSVMFSYVPAPSASAAATRVAISEVVVCFSATLLVIIIVGGNMHLNIFRQVCVFCRVLPVLVSTMLTLGWLRGRPPEVWVIY